MIFSILRVSGKSLYPRYHDGDFVFVSKIPILLRGVRQGDIILFTHPVYGKLLKRVDHMEADGARLFVVGENDASVDSRRFGAIPIGWVLARVIAHIGR